jgi:3-methyladenine DNA glycosylase AlkD
MTAKSVQTQLKKFAKSKRAKNLSRFFKTGKGEYGEGDKFIGVVVPQIREIAKTNQEIPLTQINKLISSKIHEYRLTALLILTYKYTKANEVLKKQIVEFYLKNINFINNWDLVDLSSPKILGNYFFNNPGKDILFKLANSKNLWERRIAVLSTFEFIKNNSFQDSIKISEILLNDKQDLIHKAVGWMLREIGKRNLKTEKEFLLKHHKQMPRTMLRYAIEKFDQKDRDFYLKK